MNLLGELIETELGQLLRAFLVDNFNNRHLLGRLAKQVNIEINIITSKFTNEVYDVSYGACTSPRFPSILSLLKIKHPSVTNCLIDQKKIEKVILMHRDRDAQEVLKSIHSVPRNCLHALTGDMNQFFPAPSYR